MILISIGIQQKTTPISEVPLSANIGVPVESVKEDKEEKSSRSRIFSNVEDDQSTIEEGFGDFDFTKV